MNTFRPLRRVHVRSLAVSLLAAATIAATACSADSGTSPGAGGTVSVVRLNPASSELGLGGTLQLELVALDAADNEVAGRPVVWASADTAVATVSQTGLVTARRIGVVQLQAATEGKSAFSVINVVATRVANVRVTPTSANIVAGGSLQLTATATDAAGGALADRLVFWQSSNNAVALVTSTGLVSAVAAGMATITATSEGKSASAQLSVVAAPVATPPPTTPPPATTARVDVTPASASLAVGRTEQLTATPRDATGAARTGPTVTWRSSATGVATVSGTGLVTAVGAGTATITASADGVSGTAAITVTTPPPAVVARVQVTPSTVNLERDDEATLTAAVFDAAGTLLAGRSCEWSGGRSDSGNNKPIVSIVKLTPITARIQAKAEGRTTVTATCDGRTGSATVTVDD